MQENPAKRPPIDDFIASVQALKRALAQELTNRGPDEAVAEQTLYERWLRHDEWRVRSEALPLLFGVEPSEWSTVITGLELGLQVQDAWDALQSCIVGGQFPPLIAAQREEDEWRVNPVDFYHWVRGQGLDVSHAFEDLAQFIATVVKRPQPSQYAQYPLFGAAVPPQAQASEREKILGAALNVLAKCPEACRDEHGLVSGEAIARLICEQSIRWFDAPQPTADPADMAALIDRWLE